MVKRALLELAFRISSSPFGGWFFTTIWPPVDRVLLRASRGRYSVAGLGVPVLLLTTRGRRSGRLRDVPLLYLPYDATAAADCPLQSVVVVGSRGGGRLTPAWYYNLLNDPIAQVSMAGVSSMYRARMLDGVERDAQWARFLKVNPGSHAMKRVWAARFRWFC